MATFTINNHKWQLEIKDGEELLNEYHKRHPDAYACFGLTIYGEHKIWIAKELCYDEKIRTLRHELTHCYIWENGFYNADINNEELICDFVASIYDFIKEIIESDILKGSGEE